MAGRKKRGGGTKGKLDSRELALAIKGLEVTQRSGVPILDGMENVAARTKDRKLGAALMRVRTKLREGEGITGPLRSEGVFPPMVIQMVHAGEETGKLDEMLGKLAAILERSLRGEADKSLPCQIAVATRQMSGLLSAGIPFIACAEIAAEGTLHPGLKRALFQVRDDLKLGESCTTAFSKQVSVFGSLFVSMVKAGEIGGNLDVIMERLADILEMGIRLRGKKG